MAGKEVKHLLFCLVCLAGTVFLTLVNLYERCGGRFFAEMDYFDGFQTSRIEGRVSEWPA